MDASPLRSIRLAARAIAAFQLLLGLAFWSGNALGLIALHKAAGIALALLMIAFSVGLARARASAPAIAAPVVVAAGMVALGLGQTSLIPGDAHWIVDVAHLGLGIAAIALMERLARARSSAPRAGVTA